MVSGKMFLIGIACGAAAGAALALLYAPASGDDTRRNVRRGLNRISKRASRFYRDASDAASDLAEGGADLLDQVKDAGARLVAAAKS